MLIRPDHLHCQPSQWKHFYRINLRLNTNKHPTKAPGFSNHFTKVQPETTKRIVRWWYLIFDICVMFLQLRSSISLQDHPPHLTWYLYLQHESELSAGIISIVGWRMFPCLMWWFTESKAPITLTYTLSLLCLISELRSTSHFTPAQYDKVPQTRRETGGKELCDPVTLWDCDSDKVFLGIENNRSVGPHTHTVCQQCRAGLHQAESLFSVLSCPARPLEILEYSQSQTTWEGGRTRANRRIFSFKSPDEADRELRMICYWVATEYSPQTMRSCSAYFSPPSTTWILSLEHPAVFTASLPALLPRLASITSRRKSQYCLSTSNSFSTLASLLQCLSVGWAWTMLCRARAARALTCRAGRGLSGCAGSQWSSWTSRGIQRLLLIMSQLAGDPDMASRVRDILSTSEQPSRDIRELAASVTRHSAWAELSLFLQALLLVSVSPCTLCTLEVKLITLAVSSPGPARLTELPTEP